jgi:hypothetical protein
LDRPDKVKVDAEVSPFEWQEQEILTIIQKEDGMIPVEMSFRHTTRRVTTPIPQAIRATKDWVNLVWSIPRNILHTRVSIGPNDMPEVRILELEHSTEQFDDIPLAYVWIRIGEFRRRQYRAQRTINAIQQLAFHQGQEQRGSLRWFTTTLRLEDPIPAEASLTMFEPKGSEASKRIEVYSRRGIWGVEEDGAKFWLDRMRLFIQEDRTWVFRNGLIWDGVTIRLGNKYWVEGSLPDQPRRARPLLSDRTSVWWKNNSITTERVPLYRAIPMLDELRSTYRRGEIEIRRKGMLWRDEPVVGGSRWDITKVEEYDPERLEAEGRTLPLPPPLLGVKCCIWNYAPRAVPVGRDPLKWLNLSRYEWQVSGDQIVSKGAGGYDPNDDEDDCAMRLPDFPNHGSIEMWEHLKQRYIQDLVREADAPWNLAIIVTAERVREDGWETTITNLLRKHPEDIPRWFTVGAPITPSPESILNRLVEEMSQRYPDDPVEDIETDIRAQIIGYGWPRMTAIHRTEEDPSQYKYEVTMWYLRR